jgi:lipoprotein Spr
MSTGQRIDKDELKPGDLVVFFPRSYPRHVGIYIGNNKFIHASRNRGVSMADLDQRYWKRAFRMARRLIVQ